MTGIRSLFSCGLAALMLAACDGGRAYPPGFTDDGIRFDEAGWRYWPGEERIGLTHFRADGKAVLTIKCDLRFRREIEVSTNLFEPLQQWPQPELAIATGSADFSDFPSAEPFETGTTLKIEAEGRPRRQILGAIRSGRPIALAFDNQVVEAPGPPRSMREGFARKCRGED